MNGTASLVSSAERIHALHLTGRAHANGLQTAGREDVFAAAARYLGRRVELPEVDPSEVAAEHGLSTSALLEALSDFRQACAYRAYVGEWIRRGKVISSSGSATTGASEPTTALEPAIAKMAAPGHAAQVRVGSEAIDVLPESTSVARRFWTRASEVFRVSSWDDGVRPVPPPPPPQQAPPSASSWTGRSGLRSYYSKDESPD